MAVDVRLGSPTFLQWQGFYLCEEETRSLLVSHGIALGWQVTSVTADVEIGCSVGSRQVDWRWFFWDDEQIDASWPMAPTVFSDQAQPSRLLEQLSDRALPTFLRTPTPAREPADGRRRARHRQGKPKIRTPQDAAVSSRSHLNSPATSPRAVEARAKTQAVPKRKPVAKTKRVAKTKPVVAHNSRRQRRPILLIGSSGSLGRGLLKPLRRLGTVVGACRHPDRESLLPVPVRIDMSRPASLREAIRVVRPSLIINAASMGDMDAAEARPRQAQLINAHAPAVLAEEAVRIGAGIVHFCSDGVFDGQGERPFRENDEPRPVNQLARTRLLGTQAISNSGADHLILRTGWLYACWGDNFVKRILELSSYRDSLTLPSDHYGCPTSIEWLATTLGDMLAKSDGDYKTWLKQFGGLYHASMLGYANRVEVADQIVATAKAHGIPLTVNRIHASPLSELPAMTRMPANCRLDPAKFATTFSLQLPRWQDELRLRVGNMLGDKLSAAQVA